MGQSTERVSGVGSDGVLQDEDEQRSTSAAERDRVHSYTLLHTQERQWSKSHSPVPT